MTSRDVVIRRRTRRRGNAVRQGTSRKRRALIGVAALLSLVLFLGATVAAGAAMMGMSRYNAIAETVVPAEQLIDAFSRGGARIYDRNGTLLYEFVDRFGGLRRPVPLANISPWVIEATVATEDASFYDNRGVNTRGLIRAGVENFAPFLLGDEGEFLEGSGGSSITQQLAKNVYIPHDLRAERSVDRKIQETVIAFELTERYSKDQILEWYLNSIPYGGIYTGIEAAAEGYFGKSAMELNLAEAALLAGIPQSPARYDPFSPTNFDFETRQLAPASLAKSRQSEVLDLMVRHGKITPAQAEAAKREPLDFVQRRFDIEAAHFVLFRIAPEIEARWGDRALYEHGLEITTTLDLNLHKIAEEILEKNITQYEDATNARNGAFIALDPHTAQILVYVGSRDYFREDILGRNDNIPARNSPGSTLKPFTYIAAFTKGWGTGTAILDTPYVGTGGFRPRNPGTGFQGPITVARALGSSLNIPANKTMIANTVADTIGMYKRFGYTTLDNPGGYGEALTTGGGEITLMDQAIAYAVLAAGGVMRGQEAIVTPNLAPGERELEPIALLRVENETGVLYEFEAPEERRIVAPEYTYLVSHILSDPANPTLVYSTCPCALANGYPAAAKTGTSEPFETIGLIGETWTMGYTPELVAGTWAGNADNDPIRGLSSGTLSLQTWKEFMVAAIEYLELPPTPFERPAGVVEREVCWPSGRLPTSQCPSINRYTSLYAAEVLPREGENVPHMYDSWWQNVAIDMRTGLIANSNTPSQFIREDVRLVFPADEIREWGGMRDWATRTGMTRYLQLPGEGAGGVLPAQISYPLPNATISGRIEIRGRATSPDFQRYYVEVGEGENPVTWLRLYLSGDPVQNGGLATWDTYNTPDGLYTVRVMVDDAQLGTRMYAIPVLVRNQGGFPGGGAIGGGGAVEASISSPSRNSQVSGIVPIVGSASSPNFAGYEVQVGAGQDPFQWHTIASSGNAVQHGVLAEWDVGGLPEGHYSIRVVVHDHGTGTVMDQVRVRVRN